MQRFCLFIFFISLLMLFGCTTGKSTALDTPIGAQRNMNIFGAPIRLQNNINKIKPFSPSDVYMNVYLDVLKSNAMFIPDFHKDKPMLLSELLNDYSEENEGLLCQINGFTVIDMDGDGVFEVIIQLSFGGQQIVFYCENDEIYGSSFSVREINHLKKDGTFTCSGGVSYIHINKLQFLNGNCEVRALARLSNTIYNNGEVSSTYYIDDEEVSWGEWSSLLDEHEEKEDPEWYPYFEDTIDLVFISAWNKMVD